MKFDWSTSHVKTKGIVNQIRLSKRFSFEHIRWYSKTKADKYSALSFLTTVRASGLFLRSRALLHNFQSLFTLEVLQSRCLKNLAQFPCKYLCRSLFLISQLPATFIIRDSNIDVFLWTLRNCQEHHFYRTPWNSCFCIYGTYLVVFPTIWDTHKYVWEIKIFWFCDSVNLLSS